MLMGIAHHEERPGAAQARNQHADSSWTDPVFAPPSAEILAYSRIRRLSTHLSVTMSTHGRHHITANP